MAIPNELFALTCSCFTYDYSNPLQFDQQSILLTTLAVPSITYDRVTLNDNILTLVYKCDVDITEGEGTPDIEVTLDGAPDWEIPASISIPDGVEQLTKKIEIHCPSGKKVKGSMTYENKIVPPVINH